MPPMQDRHDAADHVINHDDKHSDRSADSNSCSDDDVNPSDGHEHGDLPPNGDVGNSSEDRTEVEYHAR